MHYRTRRDEAQARLVRRPFGFQAQARDAPAHGGERAEGQGRGWRLSQASAAIAILPGALLGAS